MKFKPKYIIILSVFFIACLSEEKPLVLDASNPNLILVNGVLKLDDIPFSGHLNTYYPNVQLKSEIQYYKGKKHGKEMRWFKNGDLAMERFYINGFKSGIHRAWWENGNQKFEYYFNDIGEYHGSVKEWGKTGELYMSFNYIKGKESGSQRLWKSDGTIKANYEVVNGERFGLIGLKKCYTVTTNSDDIK